MTEDDPARAALSQGLRFIEGQKKAASEIRPLSLNAYGELKDGHWLATSVIASATSSVSGKPGNADSDTGHILALTGSFVQGIDICETAISEGTYVQASAILKQEMETLAAIREVREKRRKSGRTPNVGTLGALAVMYGDLNTLSHVANADVMKNLIRVELSAEQTGAPLYPVFNGELARLLYGLHVCFLAMIAVEIGITLAELYGEGLKEHEIRMLGRVAEILLQAGWVRNI